MTSSDDSPAGLCWVVQIQEIDHSMIVIGARRAGRSVRRWTTRAIVDTRVGTPCRHSPYTDEACAIRVLANQTRAPKQSDDGMVSTREGPLPLLSFSWIGYLVGSRRNLIPIASRAESPGPLVLLGLRVDRVRPRAWGSEEARTVVGTNCSNAREGPSSRGRVYQPTDKCQCFE